MKPTRLQHARLGLFLVVAAVLFVVGLVVLAGLSLFTKRVAYHLYFDESVAGLEMGAPVRVLGVPRGTVDSIGLDARSAQVHVVIEVDEGTPIRTDATARLGFLGLTGLRYIEVAPGSPELPALPPGSRLPTESGALGALAGDLEGLVTEAEELLGNINALVGPANRGQLTALVEALTGTLEATRDLLNDNRAELRTLVARSAEAMATLDRLGAAAVPVVQRAGALLGDVERLPLERIGRNLDATVAALRALATDPDVRRASAALTGAAADLADTVAHANQGVVRGVDASLRLLASLQRASRELELLLQQLRQQPSMLLRGREQPR